MLPEDAAIIRDLFEQISALGPETRAVYSTMLSELRRRRFAALCETPSAEAERIAAQLVTDGMVDLGVLLDPAKVAEMRAHFASRPVYDGHEFTNSDGVAYDFATLRERAHYGTYSSEDVARSPHLIEIANDARLLQIAEAYLGCPPTIYHLNAWWSFARGTPATKAQALHRDVEELRFVTLFIYLTPVGERNGPHRFIRHSHDKDVLTRMLAGLGWSQDVLETHVPPMFHGQAYQPTPATEELLAPLATVWQGPAGSAILADTYGFHMGVPVIEGERLMLWIRYGIGHSTACFSPGYGAILRPRIPQTPRARYVNRLLLME